MASLGADTVWGEQPFDNTAPAGDAEERERKRARLRENVLFAFFILGAVSVTLLQKIGVGSSAADVVPLALPLMFAGLVLTSLVVRPVFDPVRVGLFLLFIVAAGASTALLTPIYSPASLALFAALYLPMIVGFETSDANYRRCIDFYIKLMLALCAVTVAQHVVQFTMTWRLWPNLNLLLPPNWLIQDFNYLQPIIYGVPYMKPNGVVFLEVSFLSQYIALAIALELVLFRRWLLVAILTGTLMLTFAGTGVLLLALTLPVLIGRLRIRTQLGVIAVLVVIALIAFKLGWFDIISSRMNEYKQNGASANMRFIEPLDRLIKFLGEQNALFHGIGAGQIEKGRNFQWWPITKAVIEYGLIPGLLFYGFFLYTLFHRAPYRSIAFTLAVWFTFEGALLTAVNPLTCVLFSTIFLLPRTRNKEEQEKPAPAPRPRSRRLPAEARTRQRADPAEAETAAPVLLPEVPAAAVPAEAGEITHPYTEGRLIYAIGDVHGRADLLAQLIDRIRRDAAANPGPSGEKPLIVFLGDYVDRGRQSAEVIDQVIALQQDPAFDVRCLWGNHEDAMLAFIETKSDGVNWVHHGGRATMMSYGVTPPAANGDRTEWREARKALQAAVPEAHVAFLRNLENVITIGDIVFVHAGLRAGVPLDAQSRRDFLYIREEFLDRPVDCGKLIVHGHTPGDDVYGAPGRLCLDTGAYASGILSAARFDGGAPVVIDVGRA